LISPSNHAIKEMIEKRGISPFLPLSLAQKLIRERGKDDIKWIIV